MLFTVFKYLFSLLRYSSFYTLNQILIKYGKQGYLSQFFSEMFDFLQSGSNRGALQYELTIVVTMATCWIPDLHDIKGFSDHLKHSILFTANGASSA